MVKDQLDNIRHQTRFVLHVVARDKFKRLASGAMIAAVCWWLGQWEFAAAMLVLLPVFELGAILASRRLPKNDAAISPSFIAFVWFLQFGSTAVYLAPAYHLTLEETEPMLLAAFLWLSGIFVHISNTFVAMPFFNWTLMLPSFATAFGIFWMAAGQHANVETSAQWLVAIMMLLVYVVNTFETLHKQKDTLGALDAARQDANIRLQELERLARHDQLTGLLNRRGFDEGLDQLLAEAPSQGAVAVFLLDLDGFKPINDSYSHEAGDSVLLAIGSRLGEAVNGLGIAARLGGDEFAIAMRVSDGVEQIRKFGLRIVDCIERTVPYGGRALRVSASIGMALSGPNLDTVGAICTAADQAMFRAKTTPGGKVVFYEPDKFARRTTLEDRRILQRAMENGEIRPFYQPKVDLMSGKTYGFEALARWVRPDRGVIPPSSFIPQINEVGLQGDFLLHITRQVLEDMEDLIAGGLVPGDISINVPEIALATRSGRADLQRLFDKHPAARLLVTLEITEDVFITRSAETIIESIAWFRLLGLRVSLDDFGTGFASFQHLRQLEFDELKIDSSFLRGLGSDHRAEVLVSGFLSMASGLGVSVVAEGIENARQLAILQRLGCSHGQGYYFGRAMPFEEMHQRLLSELPTAPADEAPARQA